MIRAMPDRFRTLLIGLLAVIWIGAPLAARHPLVDLLREPKPPTPLDDFFGRLDRELGVDVEVALWWPEKDAAGLAELGHLWARGGYRLTPRRVYPLLTAEEAATIEPLADAMRPFLEQRSRALARGRVEVPVVVLAWGDEDCHLEDFPRLEPALHSGAACVLRPPGR